MISTAHKAKHFLILAIKIIIVAGAFFFIYKQLSENPKLDWNRSLQLITEKQSVWNISGILLLTFLNRYFEILKWQNLAKVVRPISVAQASQQVLGALTAGLFTPNGIGEYAGKALYFKKKDTKKIVFLNLICNGIQMILTTIFGLLGLLYINVTFKIISLKTAIIISGITLFFLLCSFFFKKVTFKGYSLGKLIRKINEIPREIHQRNMLLAVCRYLVFSHQYCFLFLIFDVHLPYIILMSAITSVYFLSSALPTFQFLDFAVKGSLAVFFFNLMGVNEWIVIFISTLMWLLNIALPVVIGSYFVFNYKTPQAECF